MRAIIDGYRRNGVPADLVAAAKLREVSQLEFSGNSIEGLANEWSQAVAVQNLRSPDDMIARFNAVSEADVNRVLRANLDNRSAVAAYAVPKNSGALSAGGGALAKENNTLAPSKHEPLPVWAQHVLDRLQVPAQTLAPADMRLPNGIRLIVQPEHITHTVIVAGGIRNDPAMQEPIGEEGVDGVTAALFPYGTTTYDRIAFQRELDSIAADASAGTEFGLRVLSANFDRGLQLLADEELHPAFDPRAFAIVKQQTIGVVTGEVTSPDHLAEVALAKALYPKGDPEQRFASPGSVGALTIANVKAWYASAYRPDLTTIVVIGDTTPDVARAEVEKYFGTWSAAGPKPDIEPPPVPPNAAAAIHVPANGRVQASVQLVETMGIVRTDPAWPLLRVADAVLTGGFYSSLLYHNLREVHGYVYNVSSAFEAGEVSSSFEVSYGCDPKNVSPAQGQVLAVLRQLQQSPIEPERLLRSKALLMGALPIRLASYSGVANQLLTYAGDDLPLDQNVVDARAELDASAESIRAALAKYVRPDAFVRVVVGPGP
ncbi:MAG: insulinase family protein [Candidatus Eremiobacteraeota bacterium]|nr:insulinase family protein [Candidatus Eremiobacteraeota bacterium]